MSKLLIAGTVAYDSLKTPYGTRPKILGGSGTHAAVAASLLSEVNLLSVIGGDFEQKYLDFLAGRGIDVHGIKIIPDGKTFAWSGFYEEDMSQAHSLQTDLNVLTQFDPALPPEYLNSEYVFCGNIDPELQLKIFAQLPERKFGTLDTMNFWISSKKEVLLQVIAAADLLFINDAELCQLTGNQDLLAAARSLLTGRLKYIALKKGKNGAVLISATEFVSVPAYPVDGVLDPTGAGDSFAGGFMCYITRHGTDWPALKAALIYGTLTASYNVQGFGCEKLAEITVNDLEERLNDFREMTGV